jgi:serine/threonine-protein kinase
MLDVTRMATLGRYEVLQEIGRGGEGIVFLAVDPSIDRKVAIKTLPISEDPTGALRLKLQQEAKSTARLNHPNIVTVYEFAQQDGLAYIVMEYVAGQSLAASLAAGDSYDFQTVYRYLLQAAEALDHAHSEGVIHRDIKPENLMIQARGGLKVADFGIAKVLDDVAGSKTKTGVVRGTPHYLSPEQIDLKGITGKADQFALAVVAYQWLTGHRPFEGETWTELLTRILTHDPPPVTQYRESLGERVTIVLLKALAKDPANRWNTCAEFVRELGIALGTAPPDARSAGLTRTIQVPTGGLIPPPPPAASTDERTGNTTSPAASTISGTGEAATPPGKPWLWVGVAVCGLMALAAVVLTRGGSVTPPATSQQQPAAVPEKQVAPSETRPPVVEPASKPEPVPQDKEPRRAAAPAKQRQVASAKPEPSQAQPAPIAAPPSATPPPSVATPEPEQGAGAANPTVAECSLCRSYENRIFVGKEA